MDTLPELISNTVLTRDKNRKTERFHKMNFARIRAEYRNNETSPNRKANILARIRAKYRNNETSTYRKAYILGFESKVINKNDTGETQIYGSRLSD